MPENTFKERFKLRSCLRKKKNLLLSVRRLRKLSFIFFFMKHKSNKI